ncbi:hypothetical protein [Micromonospora halophytica]|nr:hypothetical protein [Micromonospora halophytica]
MSDQTAVPPPPAGLQPTGSAAAAVLDAAVAPTAEQTRAVGCS